MDEADTGAAADQAPQARAKPSAGTSAFLDETIEFWQPRASRMLTPEDARQIVENLTAFIHVLDRLDRKRPARTEAPPTVPE
jgi:hypothetical protein